MASLNGAGQVTLLTESETVASYTGITLYKDSLYISDEKRRSVFSTLSATSIACIHNAHLFIVKIKCEIYSLYVG